LQEKAATGGGPGEDDVIEGASGGERRRAARKKNFESEQAVVAVERVKSIAAKSDGAEAEVVVVRAGDAPTGEQGRGVGWVGKVVEIEAVSAIGENDGSEEIVGGINSEGAAGGWEDGDAEGLGGSGNEADGIEVELSGREAIGCAPE